MPYFQNALVLIIETLLGLYLLAVVLRFLFQLCSVDFRNPLSQVIMKATQFPLGFLRKFIPGLYGVDLASAVLILAVATLKSLLILLVLGITPNIIYLLIYSLGKVLNMVIWIFLIAVIARAILSWFASSSYHPAISILNSLSEPLLKPARRLLPNFQGLDLSPIIVLLLLNITQMMIAYPLIDFAQKQL